MSHDLACIPQMVSSKSGKQIITNFKTATYKSNRKAMNRNCGNQKANPALKKMYIS